MKKVTLPCHDALWTALVDIELSDNNYKSFNELLKDANRGALSAQKLYVTFRESVKSASTALLKMGALTSSAAAFMQIFKVWLDIGQAAFLAHNTMPFYHLQPDRGSPDPDRCTCPPKLGQPEPCQTIANILIERREGSMAEKAVSIGALSIPVISDVARLATYNLATSKNRSLTPGERFFYDARTYEQAASHLYKAAQTYGRKLRENEKLKSQQIWDTARGIIPGIFVAEGGCPKAISIIAALFNEFHDKSPYLRTLCAISAKDGASIIKQQINDALDVANDFDHRQYMRRFF